MPTQADLPIDEPPICSVTLESITFPNGKTISLSEDDIVVLVGPNNAGKSAVLRDIQQLLGQPSSQYNGLVVISSGKLRRRGSLSELLSFLEQHFYISGTAPNRNFHSFGMGMSEQGVTNLWTNERAGLNTLSMFFYFLAATEVRITDSNPIQSAPYLDNAPNHPIASLYVDDQLEARISEYFRRAFGLGLFVYRIGGAQIPLLVGDSVALEPGEDRLSLSYLSRLKEQSVPLSTQGDGMRSFATVLLRTLVTNAYSLVLLDEPEAFLHPPQARLLGETIATEKPIGRQLFIATHSEDILQGLLNAAPGKLRIVRLQRIGTTTSVKELDRKLAEEIGRDPLMRFSSVLSGVFHKRVFICESDSDCMFYKTLLDLTEVHGTQIPDALFIQAGGKHRMKKLAGVLRSLDVPVDVIADIDVLNDLTVLQGLIESLGGDWTNISDVARRVKTSIESGAKWLDGSEVTKQISEVLKRPKPAGAFPAQFREEIIGIMGKSSPWDFVKRAGRSAIPPGDGTRDFQTLLDLCSGVGLWIVPVGELEGFCRTEGSHGPLWVQRVLSGHDAGTSPELLDARTFVKRISDRVSV